MSHVVFYTKPGCLTGLKQMEVLRQAGHEVEESSILDHPWTAEELDSYFGDLQVKSWFNPNAPRVKSGEVVPESFDEETAVAAMLQDHLLIRRPLMQVGLERRCGFDTAQINAWIGLRPEASALQKELQMCSATAKGDEPCTP